MSTMQAFSLTEENADLYSGYENRQAGRKNARPSVNGCRHCVSKHGSLSSSLLIGSVLPARLCLLGAILRCPSARTNC